MKNDIRINLSELHPLLRYYIPIIIKYANKEGIYIIVTEGFRTKKYQDELYAKGRTKPGDVVTNAKGSDYQSQHQWGIAFDIAIANPCHTWDAGYFKRVSDIAKKHCKYIGWGGDWTTPVDKPHFYINIWGSTPDILKRIYGTPSGFKKVWKAKVTGTKNGLSIWNKARTKRLVKKKPNGTTFQILKRGKMWTRVSYNGIYGYSLDKYLK